VLVLSYLAGLVAWWFSVATLGLLGTVVFFTVPIGYRTHKANVDHALDLASGHVQRVTTMLPPVVRDFLLPEDKPKGD
jgi:hypothetical protein